MVGWFRRLLTRIRHRHFDEDLRLEIDAHLTMAQDDLKAQGIPPADARAQAIRALGNVSLARENARAVWILPSFESAWQDVRYSVRSLGRSPAFTLGTLAVLSMAIGLNVSLLTVANGVLLKPWAVRDADRVAVVFDQRRGRLGTVEASGASVPQFLFLQTHARSIDLIATRPGTVSFEFDAVGTPSPARFVSGNYFDVLQLRMALGRGFRSDDDRLGAATVVVLAYETWQHHFGGSPSVLGQTIRVNDLPVTVIGVADRGSMDSPLERRPALWIPLAAMPALSPRDATAKDFLRNPRFCCVSLAGRLRAETSRTAAQAELTVLNQEFQSGDRSVSLGMLVRTTAGAGQPEAGDVIPILTLLVAGVLLVLVLACANVANLQLARALARRQEMTIRLSLGASRFRLVRQLLVEGLLLSMAAGGIAWLIAEGLPVVILRRMASEGDVGTLDIAPDAHVLLFLVVLSVASCLLSGLAPAMRTTRMLVAGRHNRRSPLRSALLATQVAISTVLLLGAALLTRGITHASSFDPGFEIRDVLAVSIALPPKTYDSAQRVAFGAAVTDSVARSGIGQVALTANVPLSGGWLIAPVRLPEQSPDAERLAHVQSVSTGYFDVLHIPLTAGRLFDPNAGPNEVVINETLARLLWHEGTALGQQFLARGGARRVVGVVRDAYTEALDHIEPTLYENTRGAVSHLLLRDDPSAAERLRALVTQIEPRATVSAKRLTETLAKQLESSVLGATLGRALGLLALLVATVGTFSVFSYLVAERTREIGVRLAIGARPRDVLGLVVSRAARPLATGLGMGVITSLAFGPFLTTYLFGVSPRDPIAYATVAAILTVAATVAVFQPARRAIRIDPAITLRHD